MYVTNNVTFIWCGNVMVGANKAAGVGLLVCHVMKWASYVGLNYSLVTPVASTHGHLWSHAYLRVHDAWVSTNCSVFTHKG